MPSTPRRSVGGHIRLAVAGALALTTITMATAGATAGPRQDAEDRPRTAAPGFVLEQGRYRAFDVPDARVSTSPGGINDRGQIVGAHRVAVPATNALPPQPRLAR
jgi:hypothetical protein